MTTMDQATTMTMAHKGIRMTTRQEATTMTTMTMTTRTVMTTIMTTRTVMTTITTMTMGLPPRTTARRTSLLSPPVEPHRGHPRSCGLG